MVYIFDEGKFIGKYICDSNTRLDQLVETLSDDAHFYWGDHDTTSSYDSAWSNQKCNVIFGDQVPKIYKALLLIHKD